MSEYLIKNYKSFRGMEDTGYECNLYRDGKILAAKVYYGGTGGPVDVIAVNPEEKALLKEHIKSLPPITGEFAGLEWDEELYVGTLVQEYEKLKEKEKMIKQMSKKTFFTLKSDGPCVQRHVQSPYDEDVKNYLVNKYGDNLKEILNETMLNNK